MKINKVSRSKIKQALVAGKDVAFNQQSIRKNIKTKLAYNFQKCCLF